MNVRQLECFRAVMTSGTMTRAAELMQISQPAVSNLIASLEYEIGFALFERLKGRLRPTPEAGFFYAEVMQALSGLERAAETAGDIRSGRRGYLTLLTDPSIAIEFMPTLLSRFMREREAVKVRLLTRNAWVLQEMIPAQQFDIAVSDLAVDHPAVSSETLKLRCVCALPEGHRLCQKSAVTPADLDGVPFISLFREHATYHRIAASFAQANATWNVVSEVQYFASACTFVRNGMGAALIDPITAAGYRDKGLVIRPYEPEIRYEIAIIHPKDRIRAKLVDDFAAILREAIAPYCLESA